MSLSFLFLFIHLVIMKFNLYFGGVYFILLLFYAVRQQYLYVCSYVSSAQQENSFIKEGNEDVQTNTNRNNLFLIENGKIFPEAGESYIKRNLALEPWTSG